MYKLVFALYLGAALIAPGASAETTIVLFRHAEKPEQGLGQLSCQGLNRALALPDVLETKFGTADALFAPNPGVMVKDHGRSYSYVRPLATIEPTAIRLGLPVNTQWGYRDIAGLQNELLAPRYHDKTLYVAWEHKKLIQLARNLIQEAGGKPDQVPAWSSADFDSLYVIRIGGDAPPRFATDHQGLDGRESSCPGPARHRPSAVRTY